MKLPHGKTCSDCVHWPKCSRLFIGADAGGNTRCDFAPSRFDLSLVPLLKRAEESIDELMILACRRCQSLFCGVLSPKCDEIRRGADLLEEIGKANESRTFDRVVNGG